MSSSNTPVPSGEPGCRPCSGMDNSDVLDIDTVRYRVSQTLPLWKVGGKVQDNVPFIFRTFVAKSFQAALDSINAMGAIAEAEGHHPNFHLTNYREITVEIWTHKLNGLTENDFILAQRLDQEVRIAYSPLWLKQHPDAKCTAKDD